MQVMQTMFGDNPQFKRAICKPNAIRDVSRL